MSVLQLLREIQQKVPVGAVFGTRHQVSARADIPGASHQLVVAARIDHKGRRREQFLCDGVRVDKAVLLRLTCPETECPQAQAVRLQWDRFHRRVPPKQSPQPAQARPLIEEHRLVVGAMHCTARPARFRCYTRCPNRAHPSLVIDKTGFDLFEHGVCIAGGLADFDGLARPRLPTLKAAQAFVLARQLEAVAMLGALRKRGTGAS
jgi:hypothetical protein